MYEIRMNHPGLNALGNDLMDWIVAELGRAGGAPVLLASGGRAFCAGLDLNEVASLDEAGMRAFLVKLDRMVEALYTYPGPTVALVEGHAIAGGCVLALACDHRVVEAGERARIGLNEVALGVTFPPTTLAMVRQRVPRRYQEQVLLGAGLHRPARALALGLVDEVVEGAEATAREMLAALGRHDPVAYGATKAALHAGVRQSPEHEDAFYRAALPVWCSPAVKAKIAAVLKR